MCAHLVDDELNFHCIVDGAQGFKAQMVQMLAIIILLGFCFTLTIANPLAAPAGLVGGSAGTRS